MIRSFRSKALRELWQKGRATGLDQALVVRIKRRLSALHAAGQPDEMNQPGFDFHQLSGKRRGTYTVHVNGPWCITWEWDDGAIRVDLENYH